MDGDLFLGNSLKVSNMQHLAAQSVHSPPSLVKIGFTVLDVALQTSYLIGKVLKNFSEPHIFIFAEFLGSQSGHSDLGGEPLGCI